MAAGVVGFPSVRGGVLPVPPPVTTAAVSERMMEVERPPRTFFCSVMLTSRRLRFFGRFLDA
jgi:hypothetical protein